MSYQFVEQLHKKAVPVGRLCRVLNVSRSGYYGSRQRAKLAPKACLVSTQLKTEFAASGKVYGSRQLGAVLRAQGPHIGRYRVRRLMRENRLQALWRRKFVHTCWDNAVMERFFLSLKTERVWQRDYANHAEAMTVLLGFYNSVRLHSTLGNLPPNAFE
jgi:transposase InsO family protein